MTDENQLPIQAEPANALPSTDKDPVGVSAAHFNGDEGLYEEMAKLNNELVNLQRDMAKKNVELEKVNELKNRLLGMAAHDLRNPLGVIHSYAESLETEASAVLTPDQRELVTTIKESSEFMLRMVTDLLSVSAIEAGQLNLDRQPADLSLLIQRSVKLNRLFANQKEIALDFDLPPALPTLIFDAGKIEQVLNNLIGNAIKFSHSGTRVRILTTSTNEVVTVAVQDQGQGIPTEEFSQLFQPFSKLSVRTTAGEQSTGLGLSIVRRIVEGHGGRIWVESEVGNGTTFFFTLPVTLYSTTPGKDSLPPDTVETAKNHADEPAAARPAVSSANPVDLPGRPLHILVAEDSSLNQLLAKRTLEKAGHSVVIVNNGAEAVAAVGREAFDLVLMDVQMPVLDGFQATAQIRQQEIGSGRHQQIVAMTAHALQEDREHCLAGGMDGYITKPIRTSELFSAIVTAVKDRVELPVINNTGKTVANCLDHDSHALPENLAD
jgi:signal transduction histidine kinase/CheY-like chemotaxis protein